MNVGYFLTNFVVNLFYIAGLALLTYAAYRVWSEKIPLQDTASLAPLIAAAAAAVSIGYLVQQIRQSIEQQKVNISKDFIIKFLDLDIAKAFQATRLAFEKGEDGEPVKKMREIEKDQELRRSASLVYNFFEGLGVLYENDKLDKNIIREMFTPLSIKTYNYSQTYITYLQNQFPQQDAATIYIYWAAMNADMAKHAHKIRKDMRETKEQN